MVNNKNSNIDDKHKSTDKDKNNYDDSIESSHGHLNNNLSLHDQSDIAKKDYNNNYNE